MKNIVFMAPIAAGKGTQSQMLKEKYGYMHISTGDIFREIISSGTELGEKVRNIINSGQLVDDALTIELVKDKLQRIDGKPFILDGFPRNLYQAQVFDQFMNEKKLDYQVIYLDLSKEEATKRTLGRLICKCGKSYNVYDDAMKPKTDGICDDCGSSLQKREEDNEESFKVRYDTLMDHLNPVLDLYKSMNQIVIINAMQSPEKIFSEISEVITND